MFESLINNINQHIEICAHQGETLLPHLVEASGVLVGGLLEEKKIFACAGGSSAFLVNHFCTCMQSRFQNERPSLPAISLCSDAGSLSTIANDSGLAEVFSRPIQALGQQGDVLLLISDSERNTSLVQAAQAAHDRGMQIVALSHSNASDINAMLQADDVELQIQLSNKARMLELQLLMVHCLIELIEQQLFGA